MSMTAIEITDVSAAAGLVSGVGLAAIVADAAESGGCLILLDVSEVTTVTHAGVAELLQAFRAARTRQCDLRLWGTSASLSGAQRRYGLDQVFRIYPDRSSASHIRTAPQTVRRNRFRRRSPVAAAI